MLRLGLSRSLFRSLENERHFIVTSKHHWIVLLPAIVPLFLILIGCVAFFALANNMGYQLSNWWLLPFVGGLAYSSFRSRHTFIGYLANYYQIDEASLFVRHEWIDRSCTETILSDIKTISYSETFIGKKLGYGTVTIVGSNSDTSIVDIPVAFFQKLDSAIKSKSENAEWRKNFEDRMLSKNLVYYPHIPKTIRELVLGLNPPYRIQTCHLEYHVVVGDLVDYGDVIATFGEHKITAPERGKICFVGGTEFGLHEWEIGEIWELQLPDDVSKKEYFAFGMQFLELRRSGHKFSASYPIVEAVFDRRQEWFDGGKGGRREKPAFLVKVGQSHCEIEGNKDYDMGMLSTEQRLDEDLRKRLPDVSLAVVNARAWVHFHDEQEDAE